jgi:hypothetical protein
MEHSSSGFALRPRGLRLAVAAMVALMLILVLETAATSRAVLSAAARIAASPTSTSAGDPTTVRGAGFARNVRGYLVLEGTGAKTSFRAGADGSFSVSFTVPTGAPTGWRVLSARSAKGAALATTTIEVLSAPADAFVSACGTALCLAGRPWYLYGASDLGGLDDPDARASLSVAARLNTLRVVNFLDEHGSVGGAPYDAARWARVDAAIAAAGSAGLHVVLDLSTYRNLLRNAGLNPYTYDWGPFVAFVTQRSNTVSGMRYADDPTIALVSVAGEVEPLHTPANALGITTQEVTSFFERTLGEWRALDAHHLLSSGGLLQLDWDSGIDWRAIFGLANDGVCSVHDYSTADQTVTTPAVAAYCASLGKPWITEEFGWDQAIGDANRAAGFSAMYGLQLRYLAAGVAFWNLGTQVMGAGGVVDTHDVNPSTPLTWSAVQTNAP